MSITVNLRYKGTDGAAKRLYRQQSEISYHEC